MTPAEKLIIIISRFIISAKFITRFIIILIISFIWSLSYIIINIYSTSSLCTKFPSTPSPGTTFYISIFIHRQYNRPLSSFPHALQSSRISAHITACSTYTAKWT